MNHLEVLNVKMHLMLKKKKAVKETSHMLLQKTTGVHVGKELYSDRSGKGALSW